MGACRQQPEPSTRRSLYTSGVPDSPKLLSVITVSSRDLDRLKRTVHSLAEINQRIEHVIVLPFDDKDSVDFLNTFLEQNPDSFLSYFHDQGLGIYQAMILGVAQARSVYFTFWNAGDELHSASEMSLLLNELSSSDANWILTNGNFTWMNYPRPSLENLLRFIRQQKMGYVSHQCILFKKAFFDEGKLFDLTYKVAADTDQIYRCYRNSTPAILDFAIVSVEIGKYSSTNHRRARIEVFLIIVRQLKSLDLMYAIYNFFRNNLTYFISKS